MVDSLPPPPILEDEPPPPPTPEQKLMGAAIMAYYLTDGHRGENLLEVLAVGKGIRSGAIISVFRILKDTFQEALSGTTVRSFVYPVSPKENEVNLVLFNVNRKNLIPDILKIVRKDTNINTRNISTGKVLGYVTPGPLSQLKNVKLHGRIAIQFRGPRGVESIGFAPQKINGNPEDYRKQFEEMRDALVALPLPPTFEILSAEVKFMSGYTGGSKTRKQSHSKKANTRRQKMKKRTHN